MNGSIKRLVAIFILILVLAVIGFIASGLYYTPSSQVEAPAGLVEPIAVQPLQSTDNEDIARADGSELAFTTFSEPAPNEATRTSQYASSIPRSTLQVERSLLTQAGVDMDVAAVYLKGDSFHGLIDQLVEQGYSEPQAIDLTDLYTMSLQAANIAAPDVSIHRLACGLKLCVLSAHTSAEEAFDPWFGKFLSNPTAKVYSVGRYDKVMADGVVEHRLLFSTDPENNAAERRIDSG
ncbi:MAG: hypothetical protein M0Q42_01320 [Xanthomonadales bacterium]|nr:hypothetical protein [Xanthomonadales bacterium]